jgi:2-oxo-4-hydroxy-4-carboxy-5-ureidoimidazoline decarboxylase
MPSAHALAQFNSLPQIDAERELQACCAAPAWARGVASGRPYADVDGLLEAADDGLRRLEWPEVEAALSAHPRIGQRSAGRERDAVWSRREQAGVDPADAETVAALREANEAYEQRFGHVFLIFATGKSAGEMLSAARERLNHDAETEHQVVRGELRKITRLRLERLLQE